MHVHQLDDKNEIMLLEYELNFFIRFCLANKEKLNKCRLVLNQLSDKLDTLNNNDNVGYLIKNSLLNFH